MKTENTTRRVLMVSAQLGFVVLLIVGWGIYAGSSRKNAFSAGTPLGTWNELVGWFSSGSIWEDIWATLSAAAGGYLVAVLLGTIIGVLTGIIPWLHDVLAPFFAFWNGFPRLAFYPFFAILFGYSLVSRMALVTFVIIFLIIANTAAGVREVDGLILDNMRMLGASRFEQVIHVYLPAAAVWIMTSARITVGLALQAAIVAEFIGASSGLGYLTTVGQSQFDTNIVWAAIIVVMVLAVIIDRGLYGLQRRLTRWMPA